MQGTSEDWGKRRGCNHRADQEVEQAKSGT